jgi:polyphosphate kinase
MIDREMQVSTKTSPGLIMAKVNSLEDPRIIEKLYEASRAGVRVLLNVRGICCLRPGVKGLSENIRVISIVDRFLEHSRVFYFQNGGREEVYLGSADWMVRNLSRRFELAFPVAQTDLANHVIHMLRTYFSDNVSAWELGPDGRYVKLAGHPPFRAQEVLYQEAVDAYQAATRVPRRFKPLRSPREK